jgi:hypothetical protein
MHTYVQILMELTRAEHALIDRTDDVIRAVREASRTHAPAIESARFRY